jgi:tetratricopeptide (TPR) repeat protein
MTGAPDEPLFSAQHWRAVRDLLARLDALAEAERARELERIALDDPALAATACELLAAGSDADAGDAVIRMLGHGEEPLAMPTDVGPFRLLQRIGAGGMGTVYLAERRDADFVQRVALKLLDHGSVGTTRFAARERRILAALAHPNVTAFVDAGSSDGRTWLAMEYVDGEPLLDWCTRHALDVRARVRLFDQVCAAVAHAHAQLVVHRDLKPSNVHVNTDGVAKLLDFGIAQVLDPNDDSTPATRVFTPEYAAPEQLRGERITTATDIHALGLLLYELVSGRRLPTITQRPHGDWTTGDLAREVATGGSGVHDAGTDANRVTLLRGDLGRIIAHAVATAPAQRYSSVALLREDLARWLDHRPLTLPRPGPAYLVGRFVRRHRLGVALATLAVLALVATTMAALWQAGERAHEAERAVAQARRATAIQRFLQDVIAQAHPNRNGGQPISAAQLIGNGEALLPRFDAQPALQADLLTQLGQLYIANSDYDRAGVLLDRALTLSTAPDIPDDVRARVLSGAAEMAVGRSKYDEAIALAREGLALLRADPQPDPAAIATVHMRIAQAMDGLGKPKETEAFLRESLAEDTARLGDTHAAVAEQWVLLGWTLGLQNTFDEAEGAFQRGVDAYTALYGPDGYDVGHAYNEWSLVQSRATRIDAAEASAREAARIYAITAGPRHRKTLSIEHSLLALMERRGHVVEALPRREALTAIVAEPGVVEPRQLANYYAWLGSDYAQVGRYDEADAVFRKAFDIVAREPGSAGDRAGDNIARREYGLIRVVTGRYAEAETILRDALAQAMAQQPPDKSAGRAITASLGDLMRILGRRDEALALLRRATERSEALPPTHAWRPILVAQRSEAELDAGELAAAKASADEALAFADRAYPDDDFRRAFAQFAAARVALAESRPADAERAPPHPPTHPRVLEVEVALAQALAAQGKRDEEQRLRTALLPRLAGTDRYLVQLRERLVEP